MNLKSPYGDDILEVLVSATVQTVLHCGLALGISIGLGILFAVRSNRWNPFTFIADVLEAMGPILPAIAIISALGIKSELTVAVLLGLLTWNTTTLFLKDEIAQLTRVGFVQAAKAMGASRMHILLRHIIPWIVPRMVPLALALFASYVGLLGALGFLGAASGTENTLGFIIFDAKSYYFQNPTYFWGAAISYICLMAIPHLMIRLSKYRPSKARNPWFL